MPLATLEYDTYERHGGLVDHDEWSVIFWYLPAVIRAQIQIDKLRTLWLPGTTHAWLEQDSVFKDLYE
jgi:hypothetical protein